MTNVPYEKGAALLRTIEAEVGRARWDAYLRGYFDRHAFQPMTADRFVADLRTHLLEGEDEVVQRLRLEEWITGTGVPDNAVIPHSEAFAGVEAQAAAFAGGTPASDLETADWTTQEWQHFLGALPRELPAEKLQELEAAFDLSNEGNSEILFAWLRVAVRNRYEAAVPALERFLTTQGRRKFLQPLYEELMAQGEWGEPIARRIYAIARPTYHSVSANTVDAIVR